MSINYRIQRTWNNYLLRREKREILNRHSLPLLLDVPVEYLKIATTIKAYAPSIARLVDVGAYKGLFAKTMCHFWQMRDVVCVEPNETLHTELRNNLNKDAKIIDCVIGSKDGFVDYYIHPDPSMNGIVPVSEKCFEAEFKFYSTSSIYTTRKESRRLDSVLSHIIDDNSTDIFLKLDTQGNEVDVLSSGPKTLDLISVCVVEYMYWSGYQKSYDLRDLLDLMDCAGFGFCGPCSTVLRGDGRLAYSDLLFIK